MPDRWAGALLAATVAGALIAAPVGLAVLAAACLAALVWRHPASWCLVALVLSCALAERAGDGLAPPPARRLAAEVTLVGDPTPTGGGVRAEARLGSRRVMLRASGAAAAELAARLAGERVRIVGELAAAQPSAWLRSRHISAQVQVWRIEGWAPGAPVTRAANALRRGLEAGAASLSPERRALFTGLVVGDDRHQPPELADDFRGAGLTHLTAVSGQNVAFVLAIAAPALRRLRLWPRLGATLAVIAGFALVTRFEPSVLRASAVAGLSAALATVGRPAGRLRVLALAATGLLLIDPLLVHSVGFRLSVAASAGILALARPLASLFPGPRPLREALGVTAAAQLGVAPLLLAAFGPMPLASLPANLVAVPLAGAVMVWGLTAGLLAGAAGGSLAAALHLPTGVALGALAAVARTAAALALGELGWAGTAAVAAGALCALRWREARPCLARAGAALALGALALTVAAAAAPPALRASPIPGVVIWRSGGATAVELSGRGAGAAPGAQEVLEAVRRAGVRSVELVIVGDQGVRPEVLATLGRRYGAPPVAGPPAGAEAGGWHAFSPQGATVRIGALALEIVVSDGRLVVEGRPAR